ncbi:MAG: C10 family peptidase [Muribaculaceae bacterium]|nr:C10 family peptidase [Muribaculaceae bacterium]
MKKKLLFLAALVLASLQLTAANVDLTTAQQSAQRFLMSQTVKGRFMATPPSVKWTQEVKNSSNPALTTFYIVNTDNGYVIVSGDDRAKDVLAYGEGSLTSLNDLPEAVQYFLDIYQKQMEYLQAHPGLVVQKRAATRGVSVAPMLQTAWAQDKPYNKQCPKVGSTYCKVGCTAVALAQVIRFWEYPKVAPALPAYTCEESGINVPALPGNYTFDWENMYDTYYDVDLDRLPQVNEDAIAYLMRYVGQAEKVDYNTNQTGTRNPEILTAIQTFGFDEGAHIVKKCDSPDTPEELAAGEFTEEPYFTDEGWAEAIQAELRAGRPLIYCAYDMSSDSTGLGGHAFNVDGYDADNDMYHVNFGMKPSLNTYYALDAFSTDGWLVVYDFWPIFFGGVQPPGMVIEPRILVSPQELSMDCYTGETATATFNVVGERLSEDITVALNDANGFFTVDASTIAVVDSAANVTVTVTYAPQAVGTHNATITLSSDGVESKVVTLKGTATNAPLVVYKPVMQSADSTYINLTSFRANWTDSTAVDNVLSYTLEVSEKPAAPTGLLTEVDWSELPKMNGNQASHATDYLPEGWGYSGYDFYLDGGCVEIGTEDVIMTNSLDLSGCDKVTVVFRGKNYYDWKDSPVKISTSVDSEEFDLATDYADYYVVLNCGDIERIKIEATDGMIHIQGIQVYAGEMTAPEMREVVETGDTAYRLITGITDKFYTVTNLTAEGTYNYKVKALYADGTESDWSNVEQVTLFANTPAHDYGLGDYNHDHAVDIDDATMMINDMLYNTTVGCSICGDLNHDSKIDIDDATALINVLLFGWE